VCRQNNLKLTRRREVARMKSAVLRLTTRLLLLSPLALAACGGYTAPSCTVDDLGDQMISTRQVFLERLAGCPIGGRH
jgi:hypothetical protein